MDKMKTDNLLLGVAIVAVIVSIVGIGITYNFITSLRNKLTGYATDTGTINLTVESTASINFTTNIIDWGSGRVDPGSPNATLNTAGGANNVTNGNWTGTTDGFVIENIGNVNVTLNFSAGNDADSLLGGTNPAYEYNVTNIEANSCLNSTGGTDGLNLGNFIPANTTSTQACGIFQFDDSADTIRVDIKLVIPSDSKTGVITDTFTATFFQAS